MKLEKKNALVNNLDKIEVFNLIMRKIGRKRFQAFFWRWGENENTFSDLATFNVLWYKSLFVTEATQFCVHSGLQQIKGSLAKWYKS